MDLLDDRLMTKGELESLIGELGRGADNVGLLEYKLEQKIRESEQRLSDKLERRMVWIVVLTVFVIDFFRWVLE
ncbi:MAG: hypothetical protein V3U88_08625 [Methylococcales bacterium]